MPETLLDNRILTWTSDAPAGFAFRGYALKADDGTIAWIDPPDPGEHEPALVAFGRPQHILVTFRDHDRAVDRLAARYGAKVWIPKGKGGDIKRVDVEYDESTALPATLKALSMPAVGYGEHALYGTVQGHRFAFIGDAVMHMDYDRLPWIVRALFIGRKKGRLQYKKYYRGGNNREALKQVRRLMNLELDALLFSHGDPIVTGAAASLKESVESWR